MVIDSDWARKAMDIRRFSKLQLGKQAGNLPKRPWLWLLGLVAVAGTVATVGVLRQGRSGPDLSGLTVPVQAEDITLQITGNGTIQPERTVNLSPKLTGRIAELLVDQGARVSAGELLARMDQSDAAAERDQAQANLLAAQARLETLRSPVRAEAIDQNDAALSKSNLEVTRAKGDVENAKNEVVRLRGVVADAADAYRFAQGQTARQQPLKVDGAISANSLDEFVRKEQSAKQALNQAQAQLAQSQTKVVQAAQLVQQAQTQVASASAQRQQQDQSGSSGDGGNLLLDFAAAAAQLDAATNRLSDTEIRAPFAGQITQRYATAGAFVTPTTQASATGSGASSTSIFALASGLEILAKVPEVDISQIKQGQAVEIRADAYPDQTFAGKVRIIAPEAVIDQNVTYFQVRISLVSGQEKLRSGMNADLSFAGNNLNQALLVPTVAIVTNKGKTGVLVPNTQGQPEFQPVTIGSNVGKRTQILEGLTEGSKIFKQLPDGKKLDQILKPDQK
jgi:HlyD family secretion protein